MELSSKYKVEDQIAYITDDAFVEAYKKKYNLPSNIKTLVINTEFKETKPAHEVTRAPKIRIMQKIDHEMEKYGFNLVNEQSKYEISLNIPIQMASILAFVFDYKSPFDTNKLAFRTEKIQFDANVSFGEKTDLSELIGQVSIKNIEIKGGKIDEPNLDRQLFEAINETFQFDRIIPMFRLFAQSFEYPPGLNDKITFEDFSDEIKLHLKNNYYQPLPHRSLFDSSSIQIPVNFAVFLIEALAFNQSEDEKGLTEKRFFKEKTIYVLCLPFKIPVAFQFLYPSYAVVSFANYMGISADAISKQFIKIYNVLFSRKDIIYSASFNKVLYNVFTQRDLIREAAENNLILLMDNQRMSEEKFEKSSNVIVSKRYTKEQMKFSDGLTNFNIYMIATTFAGPEIKTQVEKFNQIFAEVYKKICYYECPLCNFQSYQRVSCPPGSHIQNQIPFEDSKGNMVMEEKVGEVVFVKYECCGKVMKNADPGCALCDSHVMPTDDEEDSIYHIWSECKPPAQLFQ